MKRALVLLVLSASLCGLAKTAAAQMAKAGQWEIGAESSSIAGGSFSTTASGVGLTVEPTTFRLRVPVGYFITDALEAVGSVAYDNTALKVSALGTSTTTTITSTAYLVGAAYNFHPGAVLPFVETTIGGMTSETRNSSKISSTATILEAGAGVRIPLAGQTAFRLFGRYDFLLSGDLGIGGVLIGGQTGNGPGLNLGFSFFF